MYVTIGSRRKGEEELVATTFMSKFPRTDYSGHAAGYVKNIAEQVVASNFDYVFILSSLNQEFNMRRLERYAAAR